MSLVSHRCFVAWVAIAFVCQSSFAQTNSDWGNLQLLGAGTSISVKTRSGPKYHGEFVDATLEKLIFDSDEPRFPGRVIRRRELAREEIREVRRVEPEKSMVAGAVIGGAMGVGLGLGIQSTAKSNEDNGLLPVVFALLAIPIGLGIGRIHPFVKGKKVYVSP